MIILDTNVVSEALRPQPSSGVVEWLNRQHEEQLFITSINVAELRAGIEVMPEGRRKSDLREQIGAFLLGVFGNRILSFDLASAEHYGRIVGKLKPLGLSISSLDCQIAAIAKSNGSTIATRDVKPFLDVGLDVINPWLSD